MAFSQFWRQVILSLITLSMVCFGASQLASAAEEINPLSLGSGGFMPAEQAFRARWVMAAQDAAMVGGGVATPNQGGSIATTVRVLVAPNYYLYRDKFQFKGLNGVVVERVDLPVGTEKFDENFGKVVTIVRDEVDIAITIRAASLGQAELSLTMQGCADAGLCYPPLTQTLRLGSTMSETPATVDSPTDRSGSLAERLQASTTWSSKILTLLLFFGLGALLSLTPCVLPMVPILASLIVADPQHTSKRRSFALGLAYVAGMSVIYTLVGLAAGLTGEAFNLMLQSPPVLFAYALILFICGIAMLGVFDLQLPRQLQASIQAIAQGLPGGRFTTVALLGALSALLIGPCLAPPLAGTLLFISQSGDAALGGMALFVLAWGMGTPILLALGSAGSFVPKRGPWMVAVRVVLAWLLIAAGLWAITPLVWPVLAMAAWGLFAFVTGWQLWSAPHLPSSTHAGHAFIRAIASILLLVGLAQWIGLLAGGRDVYAPLSSVLALADRATNPYDSESVQTDSKPATSTMQRFQRVETVRVDELIASTREPVMLDVYADWCTDCLRMERNTFSHPQVVQALQGVRWLQVDVTRNTEADRAFLKRYRLFGPPAILFFDPQGQEHAAARVIGYRDPEAFLDHVQRMAINKR